MSEKLNQLKEYLLSQSSMTVALSGGLNREVPILVSKLLDKNGLIRSLKIDERSEGSQGRRCDFACLETLCGEKLVGTPARGARQPGVLRAGRQMPPPL